MDSASGTRGEQVRSMEFTRSSGVPVHPTGLETHKKEARSQASADRMICQHDMLGGTAAFLGLSGPMSEVLNM